MTFDPEHSVLIVGTGAMACLFAARLAAEERSVWMLGTWQEGIKALSSHGVSLVDTQGFVKAHPVHVTDKPEDCQGVQNALVLVKSWQTERAAHQLATCLAENGITLTLQNGLGNRETLARLLGEERVCQGVTTIGANMPEPGRVIQAGEGAITICQHPRISPLAAILSLAGFDVKIEPGLTALLWGKLVINAAINPLTAILRVPNGKLVERPHARQLLQAAAREAAAVAAAQGIDLPYPDPVAAAETIASRTAQNRSSMLQDVSRGAPTEIDAICGAILHAGELNGVQTPTIQTMYHLVKSLQPKDK